MSGSGANTGSKKSLFLMLTFNYELADFASRLRLGSHSHYESIKVRRNNLSLGLLQLLYRNGVIRGFFCEGSIIKVFLKYYYGKPALRLIRLISKPSVRAHWSLTRLSRRYNRHSLSGFYVISTHRGLLTSQECMLQRLSGEVLLLIAV